MTSFFTRKKTAVDIQVAIQSYYSNTIKDMGDSVEHVTKELKKYIELSLDLSKELERLRIRIGKFEVQESEHLKQITAHSKERETLNGEIKKLSFQLSDLNNKLADCEGQVKIN